MFIAIEGVDAVGKTEVSEYLAAKLGLTYYKSPGPPFAGIRSAIENCDPYTRYLFYRAAVQNDSCAVAKLRESGGVVCDRYAFSALASHRALDCTLNIEPGLSGLLMPDHCFVLTARDSVRVSRLARRPKQTTMELNLALQARTDAIFITFGFPVIDTSDTTVSEAGDLIESKIALGACYAA